MPDIDLPEVLNPTKQKLIEANLEDEKLIRELLRQKAAKDLFKFNKYILEAEKGDDSFAPLASFQKEMCHFVQDNRKKKKLLLIPRSHLKTKLISIGYSLYRIAEDPKIRILIYSATWQMAVDIISSIKRHLSVDGKFVDTFGNLQADTREWSQDRIRLAVNDKREPTVTAAGIDNNLVGGHYDLIIHDDVVNRDNVGTAEQIMKVRKRYNDSLDLLEPSGQLIVIGTRWHDNDLYGWILDSDNQVSGQFETMVMEAYEGNIETGDGFKALWPGKFSREDLLERLHSEGWSHFSAQYMNNPVPEEDATFKRSWFQYIETPRDIEGKFLNYFLTVDPALSQKTTADYTAMVVCAVDEAGYIYIMDIVRQRLSPNEIINEVFRLVDKWNLSQVGIEQVAFQKTLGYSLREQMRSRRRYFTIHELNPAARSKDERIKGLQPLYENGKVIHIKNHINTYFLEDELTRWPRSKHDDVIDALSYMLDIIYPARQKKIDRSNMKRRRYLY